MALGVGPEDGAQILEVCDARGVLVGAMLRRLCFSLGVRDAHRKVPKIAERLLYGNGADTHGMPTRQLRQGMLERGHRMAVGRVTVRCAALAYRLLLRRRCLRLSLRRRVGTCGRT